MTLKRIDETFHFEKGTLQSSKCTPGSFDFITASSDWKTHSTYTHDCEALVFAAAASGSLGRTHYVNGKFISSDLCFIITPKDPARYPIDLGFYYILFNALKDEIVRNTKAGTSKEAIGLGAFGKYELPYFEIENQLNIKNKFEKLHYKKVILSDELSSQLSLVKNLRQQFLQHAAEGKLVNQDKSDGLASDLLKEIEAEKEKLIRNNKIKKQNTLAPITDDEIPFEIPESWSWCRFGTILLELKYGTSQKCDEDSSKSAKVLRIPNVSGESLNSEDLKYTNLSIKEITELQLEENDILIIRSNGSRDLVGKTTIVTSEFEGFCYAGYLIRLRFNKELISPHYLFSITRAPYFRALIETPLRTTVGINNINTEEIANLKIPLPPLKEQIRIYEKLREYINLCDELVKNISRSLELNETLLQVALKELLEVETEELKGLKTVSLEEQRL